MSVIDLHLHSSISDGRYPPSEVVRRAAEKGMELISLTDHDSVDGIPEALAAAESFPGLRLIPGVEVSTETPSGEAHILGYFIDHKHPELLETLAAMRQSREARARKIVAKLEAIGLPLEWQRVRELAGKGSIGRPHIARAMLEKGYIDNIREAFTRFLASGGPAYVERDKMTPREAIALIFRAGGLSVLAHPLTIGNVETLILELRRQGLSGLEAYYKDYNDTEIRTLVGLAERNGLLTTGGTDFHGLDEKVERPIGGAPVPPQAAEKLLARAGAEKRRNI